jgi:predicted ATPase
MSMVTRIHDLVNQHSQLIIATHSPIIMSYPNSLIYELSEDGIEEKKLEETNHFQIMKQFLNDPKRMLHHLLEL